MIIQVLKQVAEKLNNFGEFLSVQQMGYIEEHQRKSTEETEGSRAYLQSNRSPVRQRNTEIPNTVSSFREDFLLQTFLLLIPCNSGNIKDYLETVLLCNNEANLHKYFCIFSAY